MSSSLSPGITGAIEIPVEIPASVNAFIASNRFVTDGACGSTLRAVASDENGMLKYTRIQASRCSLCSTSISLKTNAPLVMMPTGFRYCAHTLRQARVRP